MEEEIVILWDICDLVGQYSLESLGFTLAISTTTEYE
jgi:hypothetical protein